MRARKKFLQLVWLCVVLAPASQGEVLVRWTTREMPSAKALGVTEIVIPWNADSNLLEAARKQGYRVYVEATPDSLAAVADAVSKEVVEGIILKIDPAERKGLEGTLQKVRAAHPKPRVLVLDTMGKQPDMKGWLVFKKDGILQVSSPTSQPWIDSNLPLVRFERSFEPAQTPLYTFSWDLSDPVEQKLGPSATDYSLAVAEAGAFHAELLLEIPENQQEALTKGNADALKNWAQVRTYLEFYARGPRDAASEISARVGVMTDDYDLSYEALNLMARHNIGFRVLNASAAWKANFFDELDILVVFSNPNAELTKSIAEFAESGGTVVLVNLRGDFPWHASPPTKTNPHSVSYEVGKGRVIELGEPVTDPETFAKDIRRLMVKQRIPVSLWNSLTTLVASYPGPAAGETVLELVNYAEETVQAQVQVKGNFDSVRFESPEHGCCEMLNPSHVDGLTEFVVRDLVIGGRVHLSAKSSRPSKSVNPKD
jgi:hypothetical protein